MHCGRWVGNGYCLFPALQKGVQLSLSIAIWGIFPWGAPINGQKQPLLTFSGLLLHFALCSVQFYISMPVFCSSADHFRACFVVNWAKKSLLFAFSGLLLCFAYVPC